MPEFLIFLIIGLFFGLVALNGLSTSWFIVKLASSLSNISLVHSLDWLSSGYCLSGTVFCFMCSYWIPISPLLALLYVFWPAIPLPFSFMQAWPLLILLPFLVKQLIKIIYALRLSSVNRFYKKYFPLNLIFTLQCLCISTNRLLLGDSSVVLKPISNFKQSNSFVRNPPTKYMENWSVTHMGHIHLSSLFCLVSASMIGGILLFQRYNDKTVAGRSISSRCGNSWLAAEALLTQTCYSCCEQMWIST